MSYTLGIDIGTFESKGVLVDGSGAIINRAAKSHKMIVPQPGWAEHRAQEDWWDDFTFLSHTLLSDSKVQPQQIKAVACSAIGPCMLPVTESGTPLMNAVLYGVDTRAVKEMSELTENIGENVLLERCGNALTSQSVGPKILWLKNNHPEIYGKTAKILSSTSYLVYKLTGETVIDHYTAANFAPLYDVEKLDWIDDLAGQIIDLDKLPRLAWSTEIAGVITETAASETGLAVGTPVTTGTIDAAAEALSVGVTGVGDMMLMYGSTIFIINLTDTRIRDSRFWYAPWLFKGQHASMAGLATSGTLTHWFVDQLAKDLDPKQAFAQLAEEAENSPKGAKGLLALPYFSGERSPIHDPFAKGCLFGLNLTHQRADIYRAILEGIAYGTNHVIQTYQQVGQSPRRLLAVGGGTRNNIWAQATSDITGIDQVICEQTMGAAYGNAFLAALALEEVKIEDIMDWNPVKESIRAEQSSIYEKQYSLFRRLYEQTQNIAVELSSLT